MQERNRKNNQYPLKDQGKHYGRQGFEKNSGQEAAQDLKHTVSNTQKGKNKADADPSKETDHPVDQD